jgi:subfamily B ATP-binding cassette protein HlyB/CyaB
MIHSNVAGDAFFWVLQGVCALHRKPFSDPLARQQLAAPHTAESLLGAMQAYGFDAVHRKAKAEKLHKETFPLLAWLKPKAAEAVEVGAEQGGEQSEEGGVAPKEVAEHMAPALILQADGTKVLLAEAGDARPRTLELPEFALRYSGYITRVTPQADPAADPDSEDQARMSRKFGFSWFVPELLKHKKLWQEVLLASLVIQLIALATPLFTQAIIDKVVVHRTESTLIVIAIGMFVFMVFSAALSWLRQYLVLHTGNRVDAVLGSSVFERLFKLPPMYFQHRPTGVIAARLHGVETIREFIASAAVTLILDFPFLLIFVAIMVLLQRHADVDRAGHPGHHRYPEPGGGAHVPGTAARAVPDGGAQPGLPHGIRSGP